MKWVLQVKDGRPRTTSSYQKATLDKWLQENEGKYLEVTPRDKISVGKRRYFEGAIIPAYCEWHEALDHKNPDHRELVREMLKTEFNGTVIKGVFDKPQKVARSTANLSNEDFGRFLERITNYFAENHIPIPDPALWKRYTDMFQDECSDYYEWLEKHNMRCDGTERSVRRLSGEDVQSTA